MTRSVLHDGLLAGDLRSSLRKAIAMSDEPEVSFAHFSHLVRTLVAGAKEGSDKERLRAARQICISLWMLFVWARGAGNVESPYLASEFALLHVWHMTKDIAGASGRSSGQAGLVIHRLLELHFQVWNELVGPKVLRNAGASYAISVAVRSAAPVDVNLALFNLLGRIALRGLWLAWEDGQGRFPVPRTETTTGSETDFVADRLVALIGANPALLSPMSEYQAVDLQLAFMFLAWHGGCAETLRDWIGELALRGEYAFRSQKAYPCIHNDYRDLAEHPRLRTEEHRKEATAASVLWPTYAFWAAGLGPPAIADRVAAFAGKHLAHCNFQLWLPDEGSEAALYIDDGGHGAAFCDIPVADGGSAVVEYVLRECATETPFHRLSAVAHGLWPLVAMACRHYRLPIPPHLWVDLMPGLNSLQNATGVAL